MGGGWSHIAHRVLRRRGLRFDKQPRRVWLRLRRLLLLHMHGERRLTRSGHGVTVLNILSRTNSSAKLKRERSREDGGREEEPTPRWMRVGQKLSIGMQKKPVGTNRWQIKPGLWSSNQRTRSGSMFCELPYIAMYSVVPLFRPTQSTFCRIRHYSLGST